MNFNILITHDYCISLFNNKLEMKIRYNLRGIVLGRHSSQNGETTTFGLNSHSLTVENRTVGGRDLR